MGLPALAEAMAPKAMKKAMTSGAIVSQVAEKTELKPKHVRAVFAELREVAYAEVAKTEQFTIPQMAAEVEAQARTEGRHEDDVRKGGAGGSEARQQGGEGLPGQEPEGLHLSYLALLPLRLRPPGDAVLLVVMPRRMLRPGPRSGGAAREYGCQEHSCTLS